MTEALWPWTGLSWEQEIASMSRHMCCGTRPGDCVLEADGKPCIAEGRYHDMAIEWLEHAIAKGWHTDPRARREAAGQHTDNGNA